MPSKKTDVKKEPQKQKKDKDDGILGTGMAERTRKLLRDRGSWTEKQLEDALK